MILLLLLKIYSHKIKLESLKYYYVVEMLDKYNIY